MNTGGFQHIGRQEKKSSLSSYNFSETVPEDSPVNDVHVCE